MRIHCLKAVAFIAALVALAALPAQASSHREAFDTQNDPCIDNTDVYAWVTPGSHDKLTLIAGFAGLYEPGQGNQQARLCDDVLYEFHISRGIGPLDDELTYQIDFRSNPAPFVDPADLDAPVGGGKELLVQISGVRQAYNVFKVEKTGENGEASVRTLIGKNLPVAPPNVGPNTDRLAYGLGAFDPTDPDTHNVSLYSDAFAASFIRPLGTGGSEGRAWAGTRDDGFYLDEKAIFDVLNLAGILGRTGPGEDVFAGFNLNVIALEIPIEKVTGTGLPPAHNGTPGDDTLLGVYVSASRREKVVYGDADAGFADKKVGPWVQLGREGLPLVNAGLIGVQDHRKYLRTTPETDVENFAAYFLNPILVRDAEALGIYTFLGVPQSTVDTLKTGRLDILSVINLDNIPTPGAHHVPIAPGTTGDVLRLDIATDSGFPNGRPLIGGAAANKEQADVSDVLISLILAGDPGAGIGDGVSSNDKDYLTEFPYLPKPHQGLFEGHGAPAP